MLTAAMLIIPLLLPARALARLLRRAELIPDSRFRERPVVASLVGFCSLLAFAWVVLTTWSLLTNLPVRDGGPLAGALMLSCLLFMFVLMTGELVLVGRLAPARRAESVPVC
jgi:uncharacterized membrane protein YqhA